MPNKSLPVCKAFDARAPRTRDNHKISVRKYDDFASTAGCNKFDDLSREYVCANWKGIFASFGTYLLDATQKDGVRKLSPESMSQYMGRLKTALELKFKTSEEKFPDILKQDEWARDIIRALEMRAAVLAMKRGDTIKESTVGIRRDLTIKICKELMSLGTHAGYMNR